MHLRRAQLEAEKCWGSAAQVRRERCRMVRKGKDAGRCTASFTGAHPMDCPGGRTSCAVGRLNGAAGLSFFVIEGAGPTFEAAFARYDNSRARDRASYCRSSRYHNRTRRCAICKYRGPSKLEWLGELQPDGTFLATDEGKAKWEQERAAATAHREAQAAAIHEHAAAELERQEGAEA